MLLGAFGFFLILVGMSLLAVAVALCVIFLKIVLRKYFSIPERCLNMEQVGNVRQHNWVFFFFFTFYKTMVYFIQKITLMIEFDSFILSHFSMSV